MRLLRRLPAALVIAMLGCAPEAKPEGTPVTVRQADTLDPDEIGIGKYVFEVKVPAGKVMVLRRTEERNDRKEGKVHETIQHTNGGPARQVVLVYDSSSFPFAEGAKDKVQIRAQAGGAIYPDRRCTSRSISPGRLTLKLTGEGKDPVKLTYDCFIEDYEVAKKRVPNLPAASPIETWSFNATLGDE